MYYMSEWNLLTPANSHEVQINNLKLILFSLRTTLYHIIHLCSEDEKFLQVWNDMKMSILGAFLGERTL